MESTSFISIKKADLIPLCNKCVTRIWEIRKSKETRYINQVIEERDWWLKRLFGIKRLTFGQAKSIIEAEIASSTGNDWQLAHFGDYHSITGWAALEIAEKLLKACNQVEDDGIILLSVEDFNYIS